MYKMYDTSAAIREIQIYLDKIGVTENYIAPSGVYDDVTRAAVIKFQEKFEIPMSGIVSKETFDLLYREFLMEKIIEKSSVNTRQSHFYPYKLGDFGDHIKQFNNELISVLDYFGIYHTLRSSSYYSEQTEEAHLTLRRVFGLEDGGADELFHDRLLTEIKYINLANNSAHIE